VAQKNIGYVCIDLFQIISVLNVNFLGSCLKIIKLICSNFNWLGNMRVSASLFIRAVGTFDQQLGLLLELSQLLGA